MLPYGNEKRMKPMKKVTIAKNDSGQRLDKFLFKYFKSIPASIVYKGIPVVEMNEQMASVLVSNLVKNAYVHSPEGSVVEVTLSADGFDISNPGLQPLDRDKIFRRFYQPGRRKEGSTGLGLALAFSVCERNGFTIGYDFSENRHKLSVIFKN